MTLSDWILNHYIEVFGAITGVVYVFLEIRQSIWLWPVGIVTSAVYIWVFLTSKFYADMSLQAYYVFISCLGWYWWIRGKGQNEEGGNNVLNVSRITQKLAIVLTFVFVILYVLMWQILNRLTDSPVPGWDAFITSLSIVATWMLARKIFEHWYLWILVNFTSVVIFMIKGLYPTVILYLIYGIMSFAGLIAWRKTINLNE